MPCTSFTFLPHADYTVHSLSRHPEGVKMATNEPPCWLLVVGLLEDLWPCWAHSVTLCYRTDSWTLSPCLYTSRSEAFSRMALLAIDILRPPGAAFMGALLSEPSSDSELWLVGQLDTLDESLSEGRRAMKLALRGCGG